MDPVIIQKQIFITSDTKEDTLSMVLKIAIGVLVMILFGIIGNQLYNGNKEIMEQLLIPFAMFTCVLIFNKVSPFKLFE